MAKCNDETMILIGPECKYGESMNIGGPRGFRSWVWALISTVEMTMKINKECRLWFYHVKVERINWNERERERERENWRVLIWQLMSTG